jgi:ABC-type amino acid transport substrate-binding protein
MSKTKWGFFTGLLNGLAADWTGTGPTYRRWALPDTCTAMRLHSVGQYTGFVVDFSLLIATVVMAIEKINTWINIIPALLLVVAMITANVIAARLP